MCEEQAARHEHHRRTDLEWEKVQVRFDLGLVSMEIFALEKEVPNFSISLLTQSHPLAQYFSTCMAGMRNKTLSNVWRRVIFVELLFGLQEARTIMGHNVALIASQLS